MEEIILATLVGLVCGTFTGLVPGIHINLVSASIVGIVGKTGIDPLSAAVFIIAMSVAHTFLDFIPSVFLGAPDTDTVLSVLPGHAYLLEGKGFEAVILSVYGSIAGLMLVVLVTPLLLLIFPKIYPYVQKNILWIIFLAVFMVIIKEKHILRASIVFMFSGILGVVVLGTHMQQPLLPMLSGLFGVSSLVLSIGSSPNIPKQIISFPEFKVFKELKIILASLFSGCLTGFLPGIGAAQASVISSSPFKKIGFRELIIMNGAINTIVMIVGLIALYAIDKTRNGSVVAVKEMMGSIDVNIFMILIAVALLSGGISCFIAKYMALRSSNLISRVDYTLLCLCIIFLIAVIVVFIAGTLGLFILIVSTLLGMIPPKFGVNKSNLMGCLIVPVFLFFLAYS